ncbi:MAG: hypothetical protein R2710_09255 [Acidimicrobiales bacterium]
MRAVALLVTIMTISASCAGTSPLEQEAAHRLTECMIGNGGVEASAVRFTIDDGAVTQVDLQYDGQGSSTFDAVYQSCLTSVTDDLNLKTK